MSFIIYTLYIYGIGKRDAYVYIFCSRGHPAGRIHTMLWCPAISGTIPCSLNAVKLGNNFLKYRRRYGTVATSCTLYTYYIRRLNIRHNNNNIIYNVRILLFSCGRRGENRGTINEREREWVSENHDYLLL